MDVSFSINQHDRDGDVFDTCLLIHIDDRMILRFNDFAEYESFIGKLNHMKEEIQSNLE